METMDYYGLEFGVREMIDYTNERLGLNGFLRWLP